MVETDAAVPAANEESYEHCDVWRAFTQPRVTGACRSGARPRRAGDDVEFAVNFLL